MGSKNNVVVSEAFLSIDRISFLYIQTFSFQAIEFILNHKFWRTSSALSPLPLLLCSLPHLFSTAPFPYATPASPPPFPLHCPTAFHRPSNPSISLEPPKPPHLTLSLSLPLPTFHPSPTPLALPFQTISLLPLQYNMAFTNQFKMSKPFRTVS